MLAAAVLLVVALAVFLTIAKWKNPLNRRDIPKRLGFDIQQEANGFTFAHALGAHSEFKIHASQVIQLKEGNALLHGVRIELYGEDGSRVDRIEGAEFEYDQKNGLAKAAGPVEITLTRPTIAPKAAQGRAPSGNAENTPLAAAARSAASGEIHIKTSGLTFDQKTGVAATSQKVVFSMPQGAGSALGAVYDSQLGSLVLDQAVELTTRRSGETVEIHAQHAEFGRQTLLCRLHEATADYRDGQAKLGDATILFRNDGSAVRLDAVNGFTLATATGGHLAAPSGWLKFDEHNQPRDGHLEGGVKMDSVSADRQLHGTAPTADLEFTPQGVLRHAHLGRGVEMRSEEESQPAGSHAAPLRVSRTWRSPVADVTFRSPRRGGQEQQTGHGQLEPSALYGSGGVVVTGESRRGNATPVRSRLAADEVTGTFGPDSMLAALTGVGHASIEQIAADGARATATGNRLEAHFTPAGAAAQDAKAESSRSAQIQSATLDGDVVLTQEPAVRPGAQAAAPMRATAGRAVYRGEGGWLHLTLNPRVKDGGLQLTADKIDISDESGDAFARGNVKGTWINTSAAAEGRPGSTANGAAGLGLVAPGGQEPAHVVAETAHLHRASSVATFRGHVRLWQQANSIAGPVIVLDRQNQTLVARTTDPAEPVLVVLRSAGGPEEGREVGKEAENGPGQGSGKGSGKGPGKKEAAPSVVRVRGGDLKYSGVDRKAVMIGGVLGKVEAETGSATTVSDRVELLLSPPGKGAGEGERQGQVERITARGHVVVSSQGRRGMGSELTYTSKTGEYVLTGTAAAPPRLTDPARGTVTGKALIFNSRDDSVRIEGGGRETTLETTAPR